MLQKFSKNSCETAFCENHVQARGIQVVNRVKNEKGRSAMWYVGLDAHAQQWTTCVPDENGKEQSVTIG